MGPGDGIIIRNKIAQECAALEWMTFPTRAVDDVGRFRFYEIALVFAEGKSPQFFSFGFAGQSEFAYELVAVAHDAGHGFAEGDDDPAGEGRQIDGGRWLIFFDAPGEGVAEDKPAGR